MVVGSTMWGVYDELQQGEGQMHSIFDIDTALEDYLPSNVCVVFALILLCLSI